MREALSLWPARGPLYIHAVTMREIAEAVVAKHGLTLKEIIGRAKFKHIARARLEAMHACWATRRWSLHQMGHFFQRDHSTVHHAAKKIEAEHRALAQQERAA